MFRKLILKYEKGVYRLLEIIPGLVSWNIILFPYWGIFLIPTVVAYFILSYNVYWFYQSLQIAVTGVIAHYRIQASMKYDWVSDLKSFPDWKKVEHAILVCTYKEPLAILDRTFASIANQTLPNDQLSVILAMEENEPAKDRNEKVKALKKKYGKVLPKLYVTVHKLVPGEISGKSSNEKFAAIWFKKNVIDKTKKGIGYFVATSCDADHVFHPNHFASLTFKFLDDPNRYKKFWQPAVLFYNNIWKVPAIIRVPSILGSIFHLSQLPRGDRLINHANYSLSFELLHKVDYWDADKIPEDWGIFFKAYYKMRGGVEVEANYLPLYADAVESTSFMRTMKSMYNQRKRWAWGVSDDPWIIKKYLLTPGVPFFEKTMRVLYVIQSHFLWPVHWFAITIGIQLPALLNPRFARTALGHTVPRLSSIILTMALAFLLVMLVLDKIYRPKKPAEVPTWKALLGPLEFLLMPFVGFFFSALPGIDAHTRLMLGKYIQYKVTEKV
jgi:cellulose synthase/poly-beta-1,6-N-acetylglucosamine synthase-like glycosyltransferase